MSVSERTAAQVWIFNGATAIEWCDDSAFVFGGGVPLAANAQIGPIRLGPGQRIYAATAAGSSVVNAFITATD